MMTLKTRNMIWKMRLKDWKMTSIILKIETALAGITIEITDIKCVIWYKPVPLPSHIKVSAPLIIITCIFHSVFVTLKTNFRLSIKCSPLTTTGNMDYIGDTFSLFLSIFYISQRLTLWYFVFLYLIFLSQQVLYFLLSTLVLTLYIDVVLSLSIDIAMSSVLNENSPILDCIVIYQQVIWNKNSWWIDCWTPILTELYLQLFSLSMFIFLMSCALLWLTSVQILIRL